LGIGDPLRVKAAGNGKLLVQRIDAVVDSSY
jgi:hypothetical protein